MSSINVPHVPARPAPSRTIQQWDPEDPVFWQATGHRVAQRNLWISIPALLLAFAVWMVWSVVVVNLPQIGFGFTTGQLFWLTALPGLSGATLRIFYSFMVPVFGGRNWTVISTASLLLPCIGIGLAVQNPETPYWVFVILALLCGLGGGNFASSMSNISFFFPKSQKGVALGLNAGLGNLGVSVVQFAVPVVIGLGIFGALAGGAQVLTDGRSLYLQNAGFFWIPFIVIVAVAAWFGMNNLATVKASVRDQMVIFRRKHNWLMCWLYIGTFGSFIGFSAGFPMLIRTQFEGINPLSYAFLGPLVGALIRPLGGWLSDRIGGARVTLWNFQVMIAAAIGVIVFLKAGSFGGFLAMFLLLFMSTGIGNGSTFRMIPVIFMNQHGGDDAGRRRAAQESAAVLGFSSAVGAYGAFFIPNSYGWSISATGAPIAAIWGFVLFYATCIAITWWYYARRNAEAPC
jgi:MFS transporter, NNP family, nitrate/nitrite transporter